MSLQALQESHKPSTASNTYKQPTGWEKAATRTLAFAKVLFCGFAALFVSTTGINQRPWEACKRAVIELKTGLTTEQGLEKFAADSGFKWNVFTTKQDSE